MFACIYVCLHECRCLQGPEAADPVERELQFLRSHLTWVLRSKLWSPGRSASTLNSFTTSPVPMVFYILILELTQESKPRMNDKVCCHRPYTVAMACSPSTQQAEAQGLTFQGQFGWHCFCCWFFFFLPLLAFGRLTTQLPPKNHTRSLTLSYKCPPLALPISSQLF